LDELLIEIKKKCRSKNEARFKSPLYRMYIVYNYHKTNTISIRSSIFTFFEFLKYIIDGTENSKEFCGRYSLRKSESFLMRQDFIVEKYTEADNEAQYIILEDLKTVKIIIETFAPYRFSKSLVFGVLMKSRTMLSNCEIKETNTPQLLSNKLKNVWHDPIQLSSWFKYRYRSLNYKHRDENFGFCFDKFMYGQFNYFFRVWLPDEPLLHGLPMASAVCRISTIDKYMNIIDLSSSTESFVKEKRFVVLTNVFSTKILVGARDSIKMPIKLKKNYNQINSKSTERKFSQCLPTEANDLYLLDMQPHRRTLQFDKLNKNYNYFEYKNQVYTI
jgi:hypothetical protein